MKAMLSKEKENSPKHTITNSDLFHKGQENVAHLILNNMQITGGTDVDWLIERNGGFIIVECKEFHDDIISIPLGQMIAYQNLHEKLSVDGKCYFYFFATEVDTDWTNPESTIWYFRMIQWKRNEIPHTKRDGGKKRYIIHKSELTEIPIKHFRVLLESHWNEFKARKEKKIDLKPKSKASTSKITKKEKAYSVKEIRKTYPGAYKKWTESEDELLKKIWNKNKQSRKEKIQDLMQKFGRNRGAIVSRLNKMSFDLDESPKNS